MDQSQAIILGAKALLTSWGYEPVNPETGQAFTTVEDFKISSLTHNALDQAAVVVKALEGIGSIEPQEEDLTVPIVLDAVCLIDGWDRVNEGVLNELDLDELKQVFEWAATERLHASDNRVIRKPVPECVDHLW